MPPPVIAATAAPPLAVAPRRPVSLRSVTLGVVGVLFISLITFFNDNVVNNTMFIGSYLPIGLVLFFLVLVTLINAPLHRLGRRLAFTGGELAVAMAMMLCACAIPASGLMRFLTGDMIGIWYNVGSNDSYRRAMEAMNLPDWLFPRFAESGALARATDPVIQNFVGRTPSDATAFANRWHNVPWSAWYRPAFTWGLFYASFFGALLCAAVLVRRQWVENERLAFPLATVFSLLVQTPETGKSFAGVFRARLFWIAFGAVFAIHAVNALAVYYPRYFPIIPLGFDLTDIFTQSPWRYMEPRIHKAKIFFTVLGITYFVQGRVAFSVWACLLLWQIPRMFFGTMGREWTYTESADQGIGAVSVYALFVLWLGRRQWLMVLRNMLGRRAPGDPRGRYLPYAAAGWGFVACLAGMCLWLRLAGMLWVGMALMLLMFAAILLVLMRVVAETGLFIVQFWTVPHRPWNEALIRFPDWAHGADSLKTTFHSSFVGTLFAVAQRESMGTYASQGLRVIDLQTEDEPPSRRPGFGVILSIVGALVIAYVISGAALLYCEYNYAASLDRSAVSPINNWVLTVSSHVGVGNAAYQLEHGAPPPNTYSTGAYLLTGASVTALLSVLTVWFPWWPLHPLGYVLTCGFTTYHTWLSIFLAWLSKSTILRFGGVRMFRAARPLFVGLALGECAAAGFWLCAALVRLSLGLEYHAIILLPG